MNDPRPMIALRVTLPGTALAMRMSPYTVVEAIETTERLTEVGYVVVWHPAPDV